MFHLPQDYQREELKWKTCFIYCSQDKIKKLLKRVFLETSVKKTDVLE